MPLAARLRPASLEEVVGQEPLIGERGALRRMVERGRLVSMVLWGPPGVGKTTLARLLAEAVEAPMEVLSATSSGVKDVRAVVAEARGWAERGGGSTVLFIDEIHRFNKSQQDALLPHVEEGVVTLIGATTENPYFEVNSALLSRLRVFRLELLSDEDLGRIVQRALEDARGFGGRVQLEDEARTHLIEISAGDARAALNILESAASMAGADDPRPGRPCRPASTTSRPRPSSACWPTTALATGTTAPSPPSSSQCGATTLTRRCTGWPPWWRPGRTPSSSRVGSSSRPPRTWATPTREALQIAMAAAQARRLGRSAGVPVRLGAGDGLHRDGAEVEPIRCGLLEGDGGRAAARLAAGAEAPPERTAPAHEAATASVSATRSPTTTRVATWTAVPA